MSVETERWEIERDRFGLSFSGPLEVGECIEVVRAKDYDDAIKLAAAAIDALPPNFREAIVNAMKERVGL